MPFHRLGGDLFQLVRMPISSADHKGGIACVASNRPWPVYWKETPAKKNCGPCGLSRSEKSLQGIVRRSNGPAVSSLSPGRLSGSSMTVFAGLAIREVKNADTPQPGLSSGRVGVLKHDAGGAFDD